MYSFDGMLSVKVDLSPGIYCFDGDSATGKTYLCNFLKKLGSIGEPVDGYTFEDVALISLPEYLSRRGLGGGVCRVLLIDRYDMYSSMFHDEIVKQSQTGVVLLDLKHSVDLGATFYMCSLSLSEGGFEVN